MFDAALSGLMSVIAWPAIGYLFLGVFIGLYFGAVPGLSGLVGMAILLPFTFTMEPVPALAFLLGMFAVTTTSDTIASVLLGIPGTAASQATILDGYPMAMKGEASRAFGAAFTVSAVGGLLGAVVLGLSIPIVKPLILSFTQAEFFMLGMLGLAMVGSLSGDSMLRGLTAALIGLGLSYVGYAENGAVPRYWLGTTYLLEGLPLIPVVLGLFALPEVIDLAVRNSSISRVPEDRVAGGMMTGIRDAWRNWWLVLRSTAIGAYVGMLPGLGGSIVDWVAYGHVVQSSKDKEGFGKGDVRGGDCARDRQQRDEGRRADPHRRVRYPGQRLDGDPARRAHDPEHDARAGDADPQARHHLLADVDAGDRQRRGRAPADAARPPDRPGDLRARPPRGAGDHAVRVHGRMARQLESRRLDHPAHLRAGRLCDEAGRHTASADGARLRDRPDHGERALHHHLRA